MPSSDGLSSPGYVAAGKIGEARVFSKAYKRYVLTLLTLVYTLSYVDRGLVVLLLQPIKDDLNLSDTQLGFLTGIAFGLFYATLGIPIARLADRGNRVTITSIAIALWGITAMACLWVTNFAQLLCARVAAAVGESGCMPPSYSLVGDYFRERAEGARAMAIYWLAAPLSSLVSFMLGGWLNQAYGWRATFLIMGLPALLVGLVVKLTIREPRTHVRADRREVPQLPPMKQVLRALWCRRSSRHLTIALFLLFTIGLGLGPWYAAFMMRSHGMGTVELGVWLGLIFGVAGAAGTLCGGFVAGRWFAQNERGQLRLSAVATAVLVPCFIVFLLASNKYHALGTLIPLVVAQCFFFGPTFALMQRLVPDDMRATTLAIVMLFANLIGMGIGPQIVGVLSDLLMPTFGKHSLRYAMLAMSFTSLWAALHFWCAGRSVEDDLLAVQEAARLT